ncbi:unnamed protein product [Mytilus coruscus]|uniref:TRIM2_3 n=1 Tax=Mytilus coruscus TaxID=42192 RepID=A0A6J8AWY4_MYTCO|nr:unnamed protein product [Mytilus coruscus]
MACFPAKHKSCSAFIISLAEAAKNAKSSTGLVGLEHTINNTLENIKKCVNEREAAAKSIEKQEMVIKKIISDTRENINTHLDDLQRKLLNELSSTYTFCKSSYGKFHSQLHKMEKEIERLKEQTSQLKCLASDQHVFLSMHQMTKALNHEIKFLKEVLNSVKNYDIKIEIHQGITSFFENVNCFARTKVDESNVSFQFKDAKIDQAQIPLHTRGFVHDTRLQLLKQFKVKQLGENMNISGYAILANGNLLMADQSGQKVIMEYNEDGHFIRDIPVSAKPYNMIVIDTDRIAVSYGVQKYIEIIDLKNKNVMKKVKLKNYCYGISFSDGKVYVVVRKEGIVVLDMEGTILNTIKFSTGGSVYNITTTKDKIYYTIMAENTVYCCSTYGKEVWNFKGTNSLVVPSGISADRDQNVIVLGLSSNNLLVLQNEGKISKALLTKTDGLDQPSSVCYNKENNMLLVCNQKNGDAFLFSII